MKITVEDDNGVILWICDVSRDAEVKMSSLCGSSDTENWIETLTFKRRTDVSDDSFHPSRQGFSLVQLRAKQ